jgi:DNA-binding PadR family transcriptional regulator
MKLLPDRAFHLLLVLAQTPRTAQHGYALAQGLGALLPGHAMAASACYPLLARLLDEALIEETPRSQDAVGRRRHYKITPEGLRQAKYLAGQQVALAQAVLALAKPGCGS